MIISCKISHQVFKISNFRNSFKNEWYFIGLIKYFSYFNQQFQANKYQASIIYQKMASFFEKVTKIFFGSFDETALMKGTSDIIVVKWKSGQFRSTPFLVCFGHHATTASRYSIKVSVNEREIKHTNFTLDQYGYLHPMKPPQQLIQKLNLKDGKNTIRFDLDNHCSISSQVYLYHESDKLVVSDVDGTLTKDDIGGLVSNYHGQDYLHQGYYDLLEAINKNGYKIVWLTMRSLPLYEFSKDYIQKHTKMQGALITQPEQFFPAMKKQILKQTGNIKANMMLAIRKLFPSYKNPFAGGLGNRQNDAIAYRAAGIPAQGIFIVDTKSKIHHFKNQNQQITYRHISLNISVYFPRFKVQKKMTYSPTVDSSSEGDSFEGQDNKNLSSSGPLPIR